jgi:hypothetical protein
MLTDDKGTCITQRDIPILALFTTAISNTYLEISYLFDKIFIPLKHTGGDLVEGDVWGEKVTSISEDKKYNEWFSRITGRNLRLVRKTETHPRFVKNHSETSINFPDTSQYLIIGEASLQHLNSKLSDLIPMDRFRPNIVCTSDIPHCEDMWKNIKINDTHLSSVKLCGRCNVINIDQNTAVVSKEPLLTLSTYRKFENKILFGLYLKVTRSTNQVIRLGDTLEVIE